MGTIINETDSSLRLLAASVFDSFLHHLVPLAYSGEITLSEPPIWRLLDVCKRAVVGAHHRLPSDTFFESTSTSSGSGGSDDRELGNSSARKELNPHARAIGLRFMSAILDLVGSTFETTWSWP